MTKIRARHLTHQFFPFDVKSQKFSSSNFFLVEVLQHSLPYIIIFSDNENIFEIKSHNFFLQDQVQELKILTKSVIRRFRHMKFVYVFAILAVFDEIEQISISKYKILISNMTYLKIEICHLC